MRYLAPNETHNIDVPIIVGAEYTVPTSEGKLSIRTDGVTTNSQIPQADSSSVVLPIQTPDVVSGQLKVVSVLFTIPTEIGQMTYRENFGVVDILDIPATGDDVRSFLGLDHSELTDQEMDLEGKYLNLYNIFINDFHTKRQTNQYLTKLFGDLISIIEAIDLAPSLIIRIDKKRTTENGDVTRFGDANNLEDFLDFLNGKKAALLDELEEFLEPEILTSVATLQFVPMYNWATGGA